MTINLYACGSNGSSQLALSHGEDTSTLEKCYFHPSYIPPPGTRIIDLKSSSTHSLLLLHDPVIGNVLLGCGTNTLGQLGEKCLLFDETKVTAQWQVLSLLSRQQREEGWIPVKIAVTWTSSFVVYRKSGTGSSSPSGGTTSFSDVDPTVHEGSKRGGSSSNSISTPTYAPSLSQSSTSEFTTSSSTSRPTHRHKTDEMQEEMIISCGSNDFGELGYTTSHASETKISITRSSSTPSTVPLPPRCSDGPSTGSQSDESVRERVKLIRGGQRHVLVLLEDGDGNQRLVGWGASRKGELDPLSYPSSSSLSTANAFPLLSLSNSDGENASPRTFASKGKTVDRGESKNESKGKGKAKNASNAYTPFSSPTEIKIDILPQERITDISLGASHSAIQLSDGSIRAWGSNLKNQITGLEHLRNVKKMSCSWNGTFILFHNGQISSQGSNSHSQLCRETGGLVDRVEVPLKQDGLVRDIVAGSEHLLVVSSSQQGAQLWSGGWNEHGNLALGDQVDRPFLSTVKTTGKVDRFWAGLAATWVSIED